MSDFLSRMLKRTFAGEASVVPGVPSLYEPEGAVSLAGVGWRDQFPSEVEAPAPGPLAAGPGHSRADSPGRAGDPVGPEPSCRGPSDLIPRTPVPPLPPVSDGGGERLADVSEPPPRARRTLSSRQGDPDDVDRPRPAVPRVLPPSGWDPEGIGEPPGVEARSGMSRRVDEKWRPRPFDGDDIDVRPADRRVLPPSGRDPEGIGEPPGVETRGGISNGVDKRPVSSPFDSGHALGVAVASLSEPPGGRAGAVAPASVEQSRQAGPARRAVAANASGAEAGPVINVTIGRIEVRAVPATGAERRAEPAGRCTPLSLDDYLRQRGADR